MSTSDADVVLELTSKHGFVALQVVPRRADRLDVRFGLFLDRAHRVAAVQAKSRRRVRQRRPAGVRDPAEREPLLRRASALNDNSQLDSNAFRAIPAGVWALTQLQALNVESNRLAEIPPEIGLLTALTELYVRVVRLSLLPLIVLARSAETSSSPCRARSAGCGRSRRWRCVLQWTSSLAHRRRS